MKKKKALCVKSHINGGKFYFTNDCPSGQYWDFIAQSCRDNSRVVPI